MKTDLEDEVNEFMEAWTSAQNVAFMRLIIELYALYDVDENDDFLSEYYVSQEEINNTRLLRTVYLVSQVADFHSGKLCILKTRHKGLWHRMEKHNVENGIQVKKND